MLPPFSSSRLTVCRADYTKPHALYKQLQSKEISPGFTESKEGKTGFAAKTP
jgi:hypothetical protein